MHIIPTRKGPAEVDGYRIAGAPILVVTVGTILGTDRNKLVIPVGGVGIPRRYGPQKKQVVTMIYPSMAKALHSRFGVNGYYGAPGEGKMLRAGDLVLEYEREAAKEDGATPESQARKQKHLELAKVWSDRLYGTWAMVSVLQVWQNAMMVELKHAQQQLIDLRSMIRSYEDMPVNAQAMRDFAGRIRLAPYTDLAPRIRRFAGEGDKPLLYKTASPEQRRLAQDLFEDADAYLLGIWFEEIICRLVEIERAVHEASRGQSGELNRYSEAIRELCERVRQFAEDNLDRPRIRRLCGKFDQANDELQVIALRLAEKHPDPFAVQRDLRSVRRLMNDFPDLF